MVAQHLPPAAEPELANVVAPADSSSFHLYVGASAATAFAQKFVDNLDSGNGAVLASMMDPALETTAAEMKRFSDEAKMHQAGPGAFTVRLDGWLNNPEDAAYPGAYAFFAVISSHEGIGRRPFGRTDVSHLCQPKPGSDR